jgi:hypothetical protein
MILTSNQNQQLLNFSNQATVSQSQTFERYCTEKPGRILPSKIDQGFMVLNYRTKTGYFVQIKFDQYGEQIFRGFYTDWNETDNEPCNLLFTR